MAGLVHSIEELVGRTPLMELDRFERQQQCGAHLLAKLEFFNPTGSVKDRAALSMLNAAEEAGLLKPGGTIVERTRATPASVWPRLQQSVGTNWIFFWSGVPRWSGG